ncbi:tRNA (adenosine(37)-N6)-dimethylallyltransferase MiaA [Sulfurimonas sp. HSL-1716]|uniref:tRNA (adenosine(37)-N6)-dimethylallyltransferase MiaA n=1 Tax=Hydrocurvibacter sulfurireducens TaxID=3131937 RepID=UPI0031F7E9CB
MKQIAIIGPTASGKSDLALNIAEKHDAYILSIDSLSIYKEIDIASAKPSAKELLKIRHFGINEINPNENFNVDIFINIYKNALSQAKHDNKNLVIVGGTTFYLKSLLQGLSQIPKIEQKIKDEVAELLLHPKDSYKLLYSLDEEYMKNIDPNDSYRIEKMLLIYKASGLTPSQWFLKHPPKPIIQDLEIYDIEVDRQTLRKRIEARSQKMLQMGIIDEVAYLEHKYTREPNCMKSIGISEVLEYLDGSVDKKKMLENISTHTAQLAKRQQTFNRTQFQDVITAPLLELEKRIRF